MKETTKISYSTSLWKLIPRNRCRPWDLHVCCCCCCCCCCPRCRRRQRLRPQRRWGGVGGGEEMLNCVWFCLWFIQGVLLIHNLVLQGGRQISGVHKFRATIFCTLATNIVGCQCGACCKSPFRRKTFEVACLISGKFFDSWSSITTYQLKSFALRNTVLAGLSTTERGAS